MLKTLNLVTKSSGIIGRYQVAQFSSGNDCKRVAVILSGCGVFDGTEIHEAAATVVHLTRKKYKPCFYAPNVSQSDVINHAKGEPMNEVRCVIAESARIARGQILALSDLSVEDIKAAVFPGGFGAAKNLSNFASAGPECTVNGEVCKIIQELHQCKIPMGFMCISPILAARIIPCVKITLGSSGNKEKWPHCDAIEAAQKMGAEVENQEVNGVTVDKDNLVVSTPAFMYNGEFYEIFDGIGKMIDSLDCMLKGR